MVVVVVVYGGDGFVSSSFLFCFLFPFFYSVCDFDFFDYAWLIKYGDDYGMVVLKGNGDYVWFVVVL
jgi:hypothetical protein